MARGRLRAGSLPPSTSVRVVDLTAGPNGNTVADAVLYADVSSGTTVANPLTSGSDGSLPEVYTDEGDYVLVVGGGAYGSGSRQTSGQSIVSVTSSGGGGSSSAIKVDGASTTSVEFVSDRSNRLAPCTVGGFRIFAGDQSSGTFTRFNRRIQLDLTDDCTDLVLGLTNQNEGLQTDDITLSASVEIVHAAGTGVSAGTKYVPFRWRGSKSVVIPAEGAAESDPLSVYLLTGARSYYNTSGSSAITVYLNLHGRVGTGGKFPVGQIVLGAGGPGYETGDDTLTDKTLVGGIGTTASGQVFEPQYLLARTRTRKALAVVIGDSIAQGTGASGYVSFIAKACRALGTPFLDITAGGTRMDNFTAYNGTGAPNPSGPLYEQRRYSHLADVTFVEHGTNDVASGSSTATLQDRYLNAYWRTLGIANQRLVQTTIVPRTTGTYTTVAGQTVNADESKRVALNAWMRDGAPCTWDGSQFIASATGVAAGGGVLRCDVYSNTGVKTATGTGGHPLLATLDSGSVNEVNSSGTATIDGGYWTPNRASDGIHPNEAGHLAMSAPVQTFLTGLLAVIQ